MSTSESETSGNNTLVIALSTVLSVLGAGAIVAAACFCVRRRKRGASLLLRRGITPIGDEEIATWKMDRAVSGEKDMERGDDDNHQYQRYTTRPTPTHTPHASTSTSRRAPSVIQYQSSPPSRRPSLEPVSPRSFIHHHQFSLELARPDAAVLARAPNARSGLTDEAVPGDDPFLPSPKRHPSRLQKTPPSPHHHHVRTKGSRSSSLKSLAVDGLPATAAVADGSPRASKDMYPRRTHSRIYSSSSIPPRLSFGDVDTFTGLSPPPSRRADTTTTTTIGQALG
ncbi:hypothetical protein F4775DRAFT_583296 [Biscogniauxia sp. FL1348]|nr:hypothetical protein F4775DRAFT_583296 [Biscogniauxia sp. FL1348]